MKRRIVSMLLALALLACLAPCALAADNAQSTAARTLYSLGLMKGAGKNADGTPNFALDRAATRAEAVTMLVRLLGVGGEELAKERELPFSDVPDWAAQTVGYAYDAGLTNGVGGGRFGSDSAVTVAQYLTFVLRAMGYTSGTDFSWDAAWALTDRLGVTHGQYRADSTFLRGDAALVSACALRAACKNGKTLYENIFGKALPDELAQSLRTLACEAEARDTSVAAPGYASYLDELDLPAILGQPQYSQAQIRAMRGYTLDQLKDAICTVPDMIQYLVETGYGKAPVWKDDIHFNNGGYDWAVNKSAAGALATSCPSCGAVSNLTRYILEDDYTDTGYVLWGEYDTNTNRASGGHIINFYQIGNEYVTFDYESVIAGQWRPNDTSCWQVSSARGIADRARKLNMQGRAIHTIVLDRGAYRMHLPLAMLDQKAEQACYFTAASYRYDAELLYQDDAWRASCSAFADHPFFDDTVTLAQSSIPAWAFDGASDEYITPADIPGLCIYYRGFTIEPGYRFGPIEAGQTIAVYLGGVRQSAAQFTVQNTSPGSCPLTIRQDGTIVCGTALADTTIYIRCGTSEGRYILGGP